MSARTFDFFSDKIQGQIDCFGVLETGRLCKMYRTIIFNITIKNGKIKIVLNTDGWKTATTKLAINNCLKQNNIPAKIVQKSGEWLVLLPEDIILPFVDCMELNF